MLPRAAELYFGGTDEADKGVLAREGHVAVSAACVGSTRVLG